MVEYILLLNVLREQLQDEVWNVASKLNNKLRKSDIHKFIAMANLHIFERGWGRHITNESAADMRVLVENYLRSYEFDLGSHGRCIVYDVSSWHIAQAQAEGAIRKEWKDNPLVLEELTKMLYSNANSMEETLIKSGTTILS